MSSVWCLCVEPLRKHTIYSQRGATVTHAAGEPPGRRPEAGSAISGLCAAFLSPLEEEAGASLFFLILTLFEACFMMLVCLAR